MATNATSIARGSSTSTSTSSSGSGIGSDNLRASVVAAPADSCTWYANESCVRPRSCFDCLNTPLTGTNGSCTISPYGECLPLSAYAWADDFRRHAQNELYNFYPAANTTYCSQTEPGCVDCRLRGIPSKDGLYGYLYSRTRKAQCLGANGCVCVAACETPEWRWNVLTRANCPVLASDNTPTMAAPLSPFKFQRSNIAYVLMGVSMLGLIVLLVLVRRWWIGHRMGERRRARFAKMRLTLEGWYTLRQKLIDAENAEFGLKPKLTLQRDGENPASGGDEATETPEEEAARLVIERGPGYRPLSPSEYEHHRSQAQARDEPRAPAA